MKLTAARLKGLIDQVIKENRMNLVEEKIGMSFEQFRNILSDTSKKGGVQRLGIMTSENPRGIGSDDEMNKKLMKDFGTLLSSKGMQYVAIGGKYGNPENSYIILNPTMLDMVSFGKMYGQASVIYAQKMRRITTDDSPGIHFRFDYIQTEPDGLDKPKYDPQEYYVIDTQDMVAETDKDDLYSKLGNTKFTIPFFSGNKMPDERFTTATDVGSEVDALKGKYDTV
jgi:hypothetical protein